MEITEHFGADFDLKRSDKKIKESNERKIGLF
jgi:hypothetical protein